MKNTFLISLSFLALFMIKSCGADIDPTTPQIDIYSRGYFTCGYFDNENTLETQETLLKCWGDNQHGQLGYGDNLTRGDNLSDMGDNLSFVNLGTNVFISQLAVGEFFSCAIIDNLTTETIETLLKCWGWNNAGQLGLGDSDNRGDNATEMGDNLPFVNIGSVLKITKIALGYSHSCVIVDNTRTANIEGNVKCWGVNTNGGLGYGDTANRGDNNTSMGDNLAYVSLGTNLKATNLILGNLYSCAILDNESTTDVVETLLKCWGKNNRGQLGQESTDYIGDNAGEMGDNLLLTNLGDDLKIIEVSAGVYHNCALLDNENTTEIYYQIKCWGWNFYGQLGLGDTNNRGDNSLEMGNNLPFVSVGSGLTVLDMNSGGYHNCVLIDNTKDGYLKCWGENIYGNLGLGDNNNRGDNQSEMGDYLPAVNLGTNLSVLKINNNNDESSCAVLDDKSTAAIDSIIKCWGRNWKGELGQGNLIDRGDNSSEMGDNLLSTDIGIDARLINDPPF